MALPKETFRWVVCLTVILVTLQCSRLSDAECASTTSYTTDTNYYYRYISSALTTTRIEIEVKATNDAHFTLSTTKTDQGALYEILIGGWANTQSVIRRCKQCENLVEVATEGILSPSEFRGFVITYDFTGTISVYRTGKGTAFMAWTDPNPVQIKYLGYSTGWGSTGEFKFCNLGCSVKPSHTTDLEYYYRFLPFLPTNAIQFGVKAKNDAHLSLAPSTSGEGDMYEIIIGGWTNTQSVIRRCKLCDNEVEVATEGILSDSEFRGFLLFYNTAGLVSVYKSGERTPFMTWTDPNPLQVNHLGYSTGFGSTGEFKFCNFECSRFTSQSTDTSFYYRFLSSTLTTNRIKFYATASNDVHISLAPSNSGDGQMYEILIGGWSNTKSVIRRCKQCASVVEAATVDILSASESRAFLITFDNTGLLSVYQASEDTTFLTFTDPDPFQIKYLGYSTGWGSTGDFKFCEIE